MKTQNQKTKLFIKIVNYDKNHLPLGLSKFSIELGDTYVQNQ